MLGCLTLLMIFGALFGGGVMIASRDVTVAEPAMIITLVPAAVTMTPTPASDVIVTQAPCAWMWANQTLEAQTETAQAALNQVTALAGLTEKTVELIAFGETCGEVFAAMQTDFNFSFTINADTDDATKADLAAGALEILPLFPVEELMGPNPGRVTIEFNIPGEALGSAQMLQFNYTAGINALNQNLTGSALLEALGGVQ